MAFSSLTPAGLVPLTPGRRLYFLMPFDLGLFQYGELHLGHTLGFVGLRGTHLCPQRSHLSVGNSKLLVIL